jgi:hypothetical protein
VLWRGVERPTVQDSFSRTAGLLSEQRPCVKELTKKINNFVEHDNDNCKPFARTATADAILEKLARLCGRMNWAGH